MFKKIAVAAALAIMASSSFAADAAKFYAGGDIGSTKIDDLSGRKTSFGGFVGYNITPEFAVEGGYRRLAKYDFPGGDVKVDQAAISAIGTLPLSGGFGIYGRLGYNHLNVKASNSYVSATDSTSGVLYGIGASYAFSPTVSARIELQRPSSDSTNFSAGVAFQF